MKPNELLRTKISSDFNVNADLPMGHANGFLLTFDPTSLSSVSHLTALNHLYDSLMNATVQVKYYHDKGNDILLPNVPLLALIDIAEQKYGSTGIRNLVAGINETKAAETEFNNPNDPQNINNVLENYLKRFMTNDSSSELAVVSVYIPIGSIKLETGATLTIEVEGTGSAFKDKPLGVLTISSLSLDDYEYFNILKYDQTSNLNDVHAGVHETYILDADDEDYEVSINSITSDYSCSKSTLRALVSLFKENENYLERRTLQAFSAQNDVPEDVHLSIISRTGKPIDNTIILNIRKFSDIEKYVSQREDMTDKAVQLVKKANLNERSKDLISVVASEQGQI